jgi:hypothetical protein
MKDLGPLHHFLSITIERRPHLHTGGSSTCGHGSLQAVYDSSRHLGEACCGLRASGTGRLPVSEYRRCSSVPDVHPTRHRLHHAADLSTYARPQGASSDGYEAHPTLPSLLSTAFSCTIRHAPTSPSTQTLTGRGVRTHVAPLQATRSSWGPIWCPGRPNGRLSSPVLARRPSTMLSPMVWLRPLGCGNCSISSKVRCLDALWSTATTSAPSTSPPTPFSINAPSMRRLISTLFERRSPSAKSASSMSRHHSSLTSSRRVFPPRCSMSLDPVSTSAVTEL